MDTRKTRIFLVDDHPLVREGLTALIHQQLDFYVCGEAARTNDAYKAIGELKPDLVVVDISLGEESGLDLIRKLKRDMPDLLMIVLSMHEERHYAERALRAGARGYIMKRETAGKIIDAIRQVLDGKLYISENLASILAEKLVSVHSRASCSPHEILSDREFQVFQFLGKGHQTREIADSLQLSIKTVQAYCARIKEKLNISNSTELLCEAVRWNSNEIDRA